MGNISPDADNCYCPGQRDERNAGIPLKWPRIQVAVNVGRLRPWFARRRGRWRCGNVGRKSSESASVWQKWRILATLPLAVTGRWGDETGCTGAVYLHILHMCNFYGKDGKQRHFKMCGMYSGAERQKSGRKCICVCVGQVGLQQSEKHVPQEHGSESL